MIANFVKFYVKPGCMEKFVEVSLANSRGSIAGPGCLASSILEDPEDETLAYVFEVFGDEAAFQHHHQQAYYQKWLEDSSPLMSKHYELVQNKSFPSSRSFASLEAAVAPPEEV